MGWDKNKTEDTINYLVVKRLTEISEAVKEKKEGKKD
jgi:hypothetical protein